MTLDKVFLIVSAVGLTPIALAYGAAPSTTLTFLYGFAVDNVNLTHIFRAVMCLYLGLALFWIAGASRESLRLPALWSLTVFMFGLAAGRVLSLLLDGFPHWLLLVYLILEVAFGLVGMWCLRAAGARTQ